MELPSGMQPLWLGIHGNIKGYGRNIKSPE
jgi:hypothetical protein